VDVALVTPDSTPRVLNNVSFGSLAAIITNGQDTMVKLITAESLDNTSSVELEDELISLDSNGDGLLGSSSLQLISRLSDILETAVSLDGLGRIESALLVLGLVGIVLFSFNTTSLGKVFESIVHESTTAALISSDTVNQLLFRESNQLVGVDVVQSFQSANSGESPARTAHTLVLNGSDSTLGSPINGISEIVGIKVGDFSIGANAGGEASVEALEFSLGEVSEIVEAENNVILFSIEFEDLEVVLSESLESEFFFMSSGVNLVVSELPLGEEVLEELLFELEGGGTSGKDDKGKDEEGFHS